MTDTAAPKARRGFACMDPEKLASISRKGGQSVPDDKRSFSRDKGLAISAGRKGGENGAGRSKKAAERA